LKVQSLLADIKRVKGVYNGENIAEAIISIIKILVSLNQLGFFIKDNAGSNNTAIRTILAYLLPDLKDSNFRRIRYLGHIINFTAKVFLFRKDADAFKKES
jgi:hypothetical protein